MYYYNATQVGNIRRKESITDGSYKIADNSFSISRNILNIARNTRKCLTGEFKKRARGR